jgi:Tol biopolymer transport system component
LFAFYVVVHTDNRDIWVYSTQSDSAVAFLAEEEYNEHSPAISPDGHWIAYTCDKSGKNEIYITPYPGPGSHDQVSTDGGMGAMWSLKGRELFYREGAKMMVLSVETEPTLKLGTPEIMFESQNYYHNPWIPYYDIHPDGDKFVMVKQDVTLNQFNIAVNWFEQLKRLSPTKNK